MATRRSQLPQHFVGVLAQRWTAASKSPGVAESFGTTPAPSASRRRPAGSAGSSRAPRNAGRRRCRRSNRSSTRALGVSSAASTAAGARRRPRLDLASSHAAARRPSLCASDGSLARSSRHRLAQPLEDRVGVRAISRSCRRRSDTRRRARCRQDRAGTLADGAEASNSAATTPSPRTPIRRGDVDDLPRPVLRRIRAPSSRR